MFELKHIAVQKRQAAKRRARILAGSGGGDDEESEKNARLAYLKKGGQDSKEALKKAEEQNLKKSSQTNPESANSSPSAENNNNSQKPQNTQNSTPQYMTNNNLNGGIRDAFNSQNQSPFGQYQNGRTDNSSNNTPFQLPPGMSMQDLVTAMNGPNGTGMAGSGGIPNMSGMPNMSGIPNMSMPRIDPNADIDDMMKGMFGGMFGDLLGGLNGDNQTSEQILKKWKREERLKKYDTYTHNIFCLLFVLLLVFLPYDYEPNIFGYSLSSDPWTFFIGFEIIIFSMFYGYQQYSQGKDERNQQQRVKLLLYDILAL